MLQTATKVDLQKSLTELTQAMQRILTKDSSVDQGTGTQPGPAVSGQGMGTDTKALVEFEKVTVDTYRIANGNLELPLVPQHLRNMLRDFTLSDLCDLLTIFDKGYALTPAAFHRILESYGLAVKKLQHEKILLAEHVKRRDTTTIHTLEVGPELSDYICENCKAPWLKPAETGTCLACGKPGNRIPKPQDLGLSQEVDGVFWKLHIDDKGVNWKIQPKEGEHIDEERETNMKAAASTNVSDFSVLPTGQP